LNRARHVQVEAIAWSAAIVPFVAGNAAYVIAASQDFVPWCFPYLEGCTSISRAARSGIANPVFRGIMLPYSVVLMLYWWLAAEWLRGFAPVWRRTRRVMLGLGLVGALFLILYATFLGVDGSVYQWMRRYGITVHFSFTVLAQILLTRVLLYDVRLPRRVRVAKLLLCGAMMLLGLASIPLQHWAPDRNAALNAVEWSYTLLMLSYFPITAYAWRATHFTFRLQLET
jgi:hypothetical protein